MHSRQPTRRKGAPHLLAAGAEHGRNLCFLLVEFYAMYALEQLLQVCLDDRRIVCLRQGYIVAERV